MDPFGLVFGDLVVGGLDFFGLAFDGLFVGGLGLGCLLLDQVVVFSSSSVSSDSSSLTFRSLILRRST